VSAADVGAVRAQLDRHRPLDAIEARSLARTRQLLRWLPHPLDEEADPTHVTGSAIVMDGGGRVLLHRHKRLARWLQPGGHLDAGELPWQAAVRETCEETGLTARHPGAGERLIHVNVHEGPRGHVHLDLRYLLLASSDDAFAPGPGESRDVAWCTVEEVRRRADASTVAAVMAGLRAG